MAMQNAVMCMPEDANTSFPYCSKTGCSLHIPEVDFSDVLFLEEGVLPEIGCQQVMRMTESKIRKQMIPFVSMVAVKFPDCLAYSKFFTGGNDSISLAS